MNNKLTMTDGLFAYINELKELREEIKELEARSEYIKKILAEVMGDKEELVNTDGVVIATYKNIARKWFDTKGFKEFFPDIYDKYSKPGFVRMLVMKEFK